MKTKVIKEEDNAMLKFSLELAERSFVLKKLSIDGAGGCFFTWLHLSDLNQLRSCFSKIETNYFNDPFRT